MVRFAPSSPSRSSGLPAIWLSSMTIDIPMYLRRWRAEVVNGRRLLRAFEGFHDVTTRWVVTHELAEWKDEIAWMSLYFSIAVWASLALCVFCSLEHYLPRYLTEMKRPQAGLRMHRVSKQTGR